MRGENKESERLCSNLNSIFYGIFGKSPNSLRFRFPVYEVGMTVSLISCGVQSLAPSTGSVAVVALTTWLLNAFS